MENKLFDKKMLASWRSDLPGGLIVFLVALPLCLGIASASDAPAFAGIIAGVVGGIIVGFFSGSHIGVSGPAAGLAVIVAKAIGDLGGFEVFLVAVVIGGAIQLLFGFFKAGVIGYYFPNSVIKGMLAGIGISIIGKEIPFALGQVPKTHKLNLEAFSNFGAWTQSFMDDIKLGPVVVTLISLAILILWMQKFLKKQPIFKIIQAPLVVVVIGILYTLFIGGKYAVHGSMGHLIELQVLSSISEFPSLFTFPDFTQITNYKVWVIGATIALVASLETLLCVEATDKLDPKKRITPTNQELKAQGLGNLFSGLIGGLPITQVIVRSSANISSGAQTKLSAIFHGFILFICVLLIPNVLNLIPYASLAAILFIVGYKLANPKLFIEMWSKGASQFVPFIVTIIVLLVQDLLFGIGAGLFVAGMFILYANFNSSYFFDRGLYKENETIKIKLSEQMTFLNKASLLDAFRKIPVNSTVELDASTATYIDQDIQEAIQDFESTAKEKGITVSIKGPKAILKLGPKILEKTIGKSA